METKKKNFTEVEKNLLTSILVEFKDIIENKKTDGSSVKVKNAAWDKICTKFNASQLINQKANAKQLQRLWTNLKHRQRDALTLERQHRLSTGGGSSIDDAEIDANVSIVAPNLMVEVSGVVDSDSGAVIFDEDTLEFFDVHDNDTVSDVPEKIHKKLETGVDCGPPTKVSRMEVSEVKETSKNNCITSEAAIATSSGGTTRPLEPPSQPPRWKLPSTSTSRSGTPLSRSPFPVISVNKKEVLLQQEVDCRMRREEQLMTFEKALFEQRIATEKENTRKSKAMADLAELEFKIRSRHAEKELPEH